MSYILVEGQKVKVGKIVCLGANYADHNAEMGRAGKPESFMFIKPGSSLIPGDEPIAIPPFTTNLHHEVEMVLLVGKGGHRIELDNALEHVAAVGAGLDLTARDLQLSAKEHGLPWSMSKAFLGSARVTAFIPKEKAGDLDDLMLSLAVNGDLRQRGSTADMLLPVAQLIQYASRFFGLEKGDLIYTGTPAGVGQLKKGDTVEIDIGGFASASFDVTEEQDLEKC